MTEDRRTCGEADEEGEVFGGGAERFWVSEREEKRAVVAKDFEADILNADSDFGTVGGDAECIVVNADFP